MLINNLHSTTTLVGDHQPVIFSLIDKVKLPDPTWRKNWKSIVLMLSRTKLIKKTGYLKQTQYIIIGVCSKTNLLTTLN
jgi:hypothetical protein